MAESFLMTQDSLMEESKPMEVDVVHENMIGTFPVNREDMENIESENVRMEGLQSKKDSKKEVITGMSVLIFLLIWSILGIVAFIMSLVCFGYSGTFWEKLFGFLLAIFIGPFYWLYFYFNKGYCGKSNKSNRR